MLVDKEKLRWDRDVKTFKRPFRYLIHLQPKVRVEQRKIKEYLLRHPVKPRQALNRAQPNLNHQKIRQVPRLLSQLMRYYGLVLPPNHPTDHAALARSRKRLLQSI
jgi:hypothetical protein